MTMTDKAHNLPTRGLALVLFDEFRAVAAAGASLAWRRQVSALSGLMTLMGCRTSKDFVAARGALLCEDLELARDGYARIGDIVAASAGEALRAIR